MMGQRTVGVVAAPMMIKMYFSSLAWLGMCTPGACKVNSKM